MEWGSEGLHKGTGSKEVEGNAAPGGEIRGNGRVSRRLPFEKDNIRRKKEKNQEPNHLKV